VIGSSTAAHGSARTTGGRGRRRTADGRASGSSTGRLGVSARLGAGGQGGGGTGRSLMNMSISVALLGWLASMQSGG
jgi:hypothetical protein